MTADFLEAATAVTFLVALAFLATVAFLVVFLANLLAYLGASSLNRKS